jgi:hypothetical protein
MKIAFCFVTLDDLVQPEICEAFFADASPDQFAVFCHPKNPGNVHSRTLAGRIIREHVPTRHAHVSIVEATLALFATAFMDPDNQYFVLLSETSIPITPFLEIHGELARSGERSLISYSVPPWGSEHYHRVHWVANGGVFAAGFYHHDQWVVLHRQRVEKLLDRSHLGMFEQVFAADEHYIMNVLVHLKGVPLDQTVNRRTTFVNWQQREVKLHLHPITRQIEGRTFHPRTYTALSHSDLAAAGDAWFFRKIADSCDCHLALERIRGNAASASLPHSPSGKG